jgi:hypothetical protein
MVNGVVIDVAGWVAFPPGGTNLTAWQRVLRVRRATAAGRWTASCWRFPRRF